MNNSFSLREAFKFGWTKVIERPGFFIPFAGVILIIELLADIPTVIPETFFNKITNASYIELVLLIISVFLLYAISYVFRIQASSQTALGKEYDFQNFDFKIITLLQYLVVTLLSFVIIIIPTILVTASLHLMENYTNVVLENIFSDHVLLFRVMISWLIIPPTFYLATRLNFVGYFLVNQNLGVVGSIKASWKATRGKFWKLFAFSAIAFALIIIGALSLLVGVLITLPIVIVAKGYIYQKISD